MISGDVVARLRIEANREPHEPIWTDAIAEIQSLQSTLSMIADIAHSGGLLNLDNMSSMVAIRQLTRNVWNALGTLEDHRQRVFTARLMSMRPQLLRKIQPLPQHTEGERKWT